MNKIADADELEHELRRLLAYSQSDQPSRSRIASALEQLRIRLASDTPKALHTQAVKQVESADESVRAAIVSLDDLSDQGVDGADAATKGLRDAQSALKAAKSAITKIKL